MSFSGVRSVIGLSTRVLKHSGALKLFSSSPGILSEGCSVGQSQRFLTRSMWLLCRNTQHSTTQTETAKAVGWTKMCGCCGLHTEGDRDIAEFLTEEIKFEKENEKAIPTIKDFEVTSTEGPNVELTKKLENETITIKFNINNTVDDEAAMELKDTQPNQEEEPQMVSRPPFIVEINKGGDRTIAIQCVFPMDKYPTDDAQAAEYEDIIEIEDVVLLEKGQKVDDPVYSLSGANMDGNLYDMLLNMLEERGITEEFITELVQLSTAYEHEKYVSFLNNLQDFVSTK